MKKISTRTLSVFAFVIPLLALLLYVAVRSGPLAPIAVTLETVTARSVAPALFGIGTVEARYTYKIGPTYAGRVASVNVHVGDRVEAGQLLGSMDPVDLDARIAAQEAAINSGEAAVQQAVAKQDFARAQARRYENLLTTKSVSAEDADLKKQEALVADASLQAARDNVVRQRADLDALRAQREQLNLVAPVAGLVVARDADPGSTVVAGQAAIEVVDTNNLWINTRFDQITAEGLIANLPAHITLRSRRAQPIAGHVLRVEPRADAITEELLAKISFDALPDPLPPLGELAEVTVQLPELPPKPTIPNAAIHAVNGKRGVWTLNEGRLQFAHVSLGQSDLDGHVQIEEGLSEGAQIVVHSEKNLSERSRIRIVEQIPGAGP